MLLLIFQKTKEVAPMTPSARSQVPAKRRCVKFRDPVGILIVHILYERLQ